MFAVLWVWELQSTRYIVWPAQTLSTNVWATWVDLGTTLKIVPSLSGPIYSASPFFHSPRVTTPLITVPTPWTWYISSIKHSNGLLRCFVAWRLRCGRFAKSFWRTSIPSPVTHETEIMGTSSVEFVSLCWIVSTSFLLLTTKGRCCPRSGWLLRIREISCFVDWKTCCGVRSDLVKRIITGMPIFLQSLRWWTVICVGGCPALTKTRA